VKLLQKQNYSSAARPGNSRVECAAHLLEVVPAVMRAVRGQMRSHSAPDLSVVQFRSLGFLSRRPGASLSDLTEHIGLSPPSMSKLVQGMVKRGYLRRQVDASDRRKNALAATDKGQKILDAARRATRAYLAELLGELSNKESDDIIRAMELLRPIFLADINKHATQAREELAAIARAKRRAS